jgi:hypothetical protein
MTSSVKSLIFHDDITKNVDNTRVRSIVSLHLLSPMTKDNFKVKQKVDIEME